jgi:hypothetical protein
VVQQPGDLPEGHGLDPITMGSLVTRLDTCFRLLFPGWARLPHRMARRNRAE